MSSKVLKTLLKSKRNKIGPYTVRKITYFNIVKDGISWLILNHPYSGR